MLKVFINIFLLLFILVCVPATSHSQDVVFSETSPDDFDIKNYSLNLPQALEPWKYYHGIAIYYIVPPKDWTLDVVKAPMVTYSAKYTLPNGFNLQGSLSSIFVSTRINAGPFWNYSHNNFHVGVGYQIAYNLGYLTEFGFDTHLHIWEQQPSLTLGYSFARTAVTLRGDLLYTSSLKVVEGGHELSFPAEILNGYSITGCYEQRLHRDRVMSLGLKMGYVRYHIVAWAALPVNSYHYWVPEIQVGINF